MRGSRTTVRVALASVVGGLLAVNSAAAAINCERWLKLNPGQKATTVERMIDDALAGNRGRKYEVNREAIARCLRDRSSEIVIAFDDVCSNSRSAGMQAIHDVFNTYVWSCVG